MAPDTVPERSASSATAELGGRRPTLRPATVALFLAVVALACLAAVATSGAHRLAQVLLVLGGLVTAVLAAVVLESSSRRRTYAHDLAARQTAGLRQALVELDDTRDFLEGLLTLGPTVVFRERTRAEEGAGPYASPNAERILGLTAAQAAAPAVLATRAHPEDRGAVEAALGRLATGAEREELELRFRTGDGRYRWLSVLLVHQLGSDGEPNALLAYVVDTDERHRAEQATRERDRTLAAVFAASPDIVEVLAPDGHIEACSPAVERVLGFDPDHLIGTDPADLVVAEDRALFVELLGRLASGRIAQLVMNYRVERPDGRIVLLEGRCAVLPGGAGTVLVSHDVTKRARFEEAQRLARLTAEEANRSKSEFLSRVSHELRTPLNAVLGFGQLLELDDLDEGQRESAQQILRGGRHLLQLIDQLLDVARVEAGHLALSAEPVHLDEAIGQAVDLIRSLGAEHEVSLPDPPFCADGYVLADRQRLHQVLLNLLTNAVKYNRRGGSVTVSCLGTADRVQLEVTDTGRGIRDQHLGLLFMPFERLEPDRAEDGVGMGLALCKRLVEAMGGTLSATSTYGRGSTFRIDLPRAEGPVERFERLTRPRPVLAGARTAPDDGAVAVADADAAVAAVGPVPAVRRRPAPRTVLHIEDNLPNLELIERVLEPVAGVRVMAAMQGRLGLDLLRRHRPDLVLLDLHLPDIPGDEVLRRILADPDTASIPVVIVTADATPGQTRRLLSAGAAGYLPKPIDVAHLVRVVEELLGPP